MVVNVSSTFFYVLSHPGRKKQVLTWGTPQENYQDFKAQLRKEVLNAPPTERGVGGDLQGSARSRMFTNKILL